MPPEVNRGALEEALSAAGNGDHQTVVFPGADHGIELPGDHRPPGYWETLFDWLLARAGLGPLGSIGD